MIKKIFLIIFYYPLYFLQLENYQLKRFYRAYFKKALSLTNPRQKLVFTKKLIVLILISLSIIFFEIYFLFKSNPFLFAFLKSLIFILCFPVIIGLSVLIFLPFDLLFKWLIILKAHQKIKRLKNLKIIGITGSYGKTSFKEILATLLGVKYKLVFTPENKNTPLGISAVILKNLKPETEIFVVEMSAWQKGDIKTLCKICPPDISVLTGINESHLERFKTIENTINTKFEIVKYAKPNALVFLNADNELIINNYKKFVFKKEVIFYGKDNIEYLGYKIKDISFNEEKLTQSFILEKDNKETFYEIPLLGEYAISTIIGAILLSSKLGLNESDIKTGLSFLKPIEHRLQPIKKDEFLIIDDSYNGNPNGAKEAIKVLSKFKNKRKIYVTPGLVETGERTKEVHLEIGKNLATAADLVILIKNSVTNYIIEGLLENGFKKENIIIFNSPLELQEKIKEILKPNDVVVFQNDWPDNYF